MLIMIKIFCFPSLESIKIAGCWILVAEWGAGPKLSCRTVAPTAGWISHRKWWKLPKGYAANIPKKQLFSTSLYPRLLKKILYYTGGGVQLHYFLRCMYLHQWWCIRSYFWTAFCFGAAPLHSLCFGNCRVWRAADTKSVYLWKFEIYIWCHLPYARGILCPISATVGSRIYG